MNEVIFTISQLTLMFILPILLIKTKIIPTKHRLKILALIFIIAITSIFYEQWSLLDLNLRIDNFLNLTIPFLIYIGIGSTVIYVFAKSMQRKHKHEWHKDTHFQYMFVLLSIAQQFLFQGFLTHKLKSISTNVSFIILTTAIIFAYIHWIYSDFWHFAAIVFLGGLSFTTMYMLFPNLIWMMIAHMTFNFLMAIYQFFEVPDS